MHIVILQPPVTQLNTPYPSGAYLSSFFKHEASIFSQIDSVQWFDVNNLLFKAIFCKQGISKLFSLSTENALLLALQADKKGDEATAFNLRRYISESENWIRSIDTICGILSNQSVLSFRELCHDFVYSPYTPRGYRMETYLSTLDHDVTADDARILASLALADLADYITKTFDSHFSLVRYAESLACSTSDFSQVTDSLDAPILQHYLKPVLCSIIEQLSTEASRDIRSTNDVRTTNDVPADYLFCISVPFPGTFTSALFTARTLREFFPHNSFISLGGGYVNTELRNVSEKELFTYTDILSYDRGYGTYHQLLSAGLGVIPLASVKSILQSISKIRFYSDGNVISQKEYDNQTTEYEDNLTRTLIPDYSNINFSSYPRLADDNNPMHRLWSDGSWLKAFLAHGCYWHRCTFCDNTLDYVKNYKMVDVHALYKGLLKQSQLTGIRGIHFTDEASPPQALKIFAAENCCHDRALTFWGNIRFEKVFTRDLADFLAFSGLTGVSGGIESATPTGLEAVNKGIDIEHIVAACAAFKEAGILVHAYMIYGYWQETPQDLINSLETLRQMFVAGLLDSTFFHKFTLTRHSGAFKSWQQGNIPTLHPLLNDTTTGCKPPFAENDLHFAGEQKSAIFTNGLNTAIASWMHGEGLNKPVSKWFSFKDTHSTGSHATVPNPTVPPDYIERLITKYEQKRDSEYAEHQKPNTRYVWLGGKPIVSKKTISWIYMGEMNELQLNTQEEAEHISSCLWSLRPENALEPETTLKRETTLESETVPKPQVSFNTDLSNTQNTMLPEKVFHVVRGAGLVKL